MKLKISNRFSVFEKCTHGKFHIDLVNSLSMSEKSASISPLCNLSGALSSVHRDMRANPCCGPKLLGPN